MKTIPTIVCLGLLTVRVASHASEFLNLDFEHPDLSHLQPYIFGTQIGPTKEVLQGWTLAANAPGLVLNTIIEEGGLSPVGLKKAPVLPSTGIDFGKYALYLASPSLEPNSLQPIYHLSQFGTIPAGATQLVYYRSGPGVGGPGPNPNAFQILINGQSVPYAEAGVSYADVSVFAGQQVNLEFVFLKSGNDFDIAGFVIAPEPSTYALFGLGSLALWWVGRRQR